MQEHFDKNNLHHAYLIEGAKDEALSGVFELLEELEIPTLANPDFIHINIDSFKIDDARSLKSMSGERASSGGIKSKRVFLISTNSFLLEAQNTLLKMFEDPIENTHFFLIMPSVDGLLKTFVSRFYLISSIAETDQKISKEAETFLRMPLSARIEFIKEFLKEGDEDTSPQPSPNLGEGAIDSVRSKAQRFLNALESILHKKMSKMPFDTKNKFDYFAQIFKVRKYLRQPGSSTKSLMESVALSVPEKS